MNSSRFGVALMLAWMVAGCISKTDSGKSEGDPAQDAVNVITNPDAVEPARQKAVDDLHVISGTYYDFYEGNKRSPANAKELADELIKSSGKAYEPLARKIESGHYTVIWGVPNFDPAANDVIAYERDPGKNGKRLVAKMEGSVWLMTEERFKTAPKAKGK